MEANFKSEEEIKFAIIDYFSSKSVEFVNDLSKEFKKEDQESLSLEMFRYRDSLIDKLYNELLVKDSQLFIEINKPNDFIEETLAEYILSKD